VRLLRDLVVLARTLRMRRAAADVAVAVAATAAVGTGAALLAGTGLYAQLRWLPLALWVAGLALAAAVFWRIRTRSALDPRREAAALVERELGLRRGALSGVVDLAAEAPPGTSADLAAAAVRRVEATLPPYAPKAWAPTASARAARLLRRAWAAASVTAAVAVAAFRSAGDAAAALRSPVHAWRALVPPRVAITLSARSVPRGGGVEVSVRAGPGPGHAVLRMRSTGEAWRSVPLVTDAAGRATHRLADLWASTWVYAAADGAVSETLDVAVPAPLALGDLAITARFPTYLRREAEALEAGAAEIALPVGTVLHVHGRASAPLDAARLGAEADTVPLTAEGAVFGGSVVVRRDAEWSLLLLGRGGNVAAPLALLRVIAVPDSAPVVAVPVPGVDTTAPLDLRVALVVDARDDHGLASLEVVSWRVSRLGVVGDTVVQPVPEVAGADRLVQTVPLDLTGRGLLPGDTLRFFARATDHAPVPHVGVSRSYALRLRSMAELRASVRAGGDSLARAAQAAAAEQASLTRRTEDVAAQRSRGPEAGARPEREGALRPGERPSPAASERAAEVQRLLEEQEALLARADSLRAALEAVAEAAEEAGLTDPAFQERLRDLEELLRQAITPELRQRLEELRRALQNLDARQVQEALRRLAEQQGRLRDELQRSAELFERAALEGALQTAAAEAEALRQAQERWNARAPAASDSAAEAAVEAALRREADSLTADLRALAERLARRGDSSAAGALAPAADSAAAAAAAMGRASEAMRAGRRAEASRGGARAAQALGDVPEALRMLQQRLAEGWRAEVRERLGRTMQETVTLAQEEQRLARELRRGEAPDARGRQAAVEQGIGQLMRALQEAAGRHALVPTRLGGALAQARDLVAQSRQALEGPAPSAEESARQAQEASQALAAAALQMLRTSRDVGSAQSGSGLAEAIERMGRLAGMQGQLNEQLGGLLPLLGGGEEVVLRQLQQLAQQQRRIANAMERLGGAGMPGRPEEMAEEARQLADRIEQGRFDRATLERQQRLFRRMLDAGRSLRNEDEPEDPERRSRTAVATPGIAGGRPLRGAALRYPPPSWEALRTLAPAERALVLDYFRRLNAADR
jgi:hypothetical protein